MFTGSDILSVAQFERPDLERIFAAADACLPISRGERVCDALRGRLLANLFFEPSTRTRLSFGAAFLRLGGALETTVGMQFSSMAKGETLEDTIRVIDGYVDVLVLRHPELGSAERAAAVAEHPIINAGDGPGETPDKHTHLRQWNACQNRRARVLARGIQRLANHRKPEEKPKAAHQDRGYENDGDVVSGQHDRADKERRSRDERRNALYLVGVGHHPHDALDEIGQTESGYDDRHQSRILQPVTFRNAPYDNRSESSADDEGDNRGQPKGHEIGQTETDDDQKGHISAYHHHFAAAEIYDMRRLVDNHDRQGDENLDQDEAAFLRAAPAVFRAHGPSPPTAKVR